MVTTRAQSRVKPPLNIDLDSPLELRYFSESAAYIVYQIGKHLTRLPFKDEDFDSPSRSDTQHPGIDPRIRGKLLRLRKQFSSATPVLESHNYFQEHVAPLFPPGILIEQSLCTVAPALLKHYNKELRRDEKRQFLRDEGRAGTYLAEDESHGLLVTSMIYDDQHASCDFKPKWLTQSPFAPKNAKHCRNCAIAAKRGDDDDGFPAWCPLVLNSNDEELLKKHLDGAFGNLRGAPIFVPEQVSYAIPFLEQSGMMGRLRELQEEYGTEDLLGEGPPSEKLKLAMTLRDCSMFMKIPNRGTGSVEARLGDFDLKSGHDGKVEAWRRKERELTEGGHSAKATAPDPGESLKQILNIARFISNEQEYSRTVVAVKGFENDSVGNQLHKRLRARFDNPDTENWLAELYPVRRYLRQRSSLLGHQSYFGTHPLPRTNVNVSSRAATIILAVHKFKTALETGQLVQQHVYGQAVDSDSYHWLFNACREPGLHEDRLVKHASNDDIVVMKQGIMFRVPLKENGVLVPHSQLASTLTAISDSTDTHGNPDISALTMDERDEWAKIRSKLKDTSDTNEETLQSIASAAFIVCLDSSKPSGPEERFRHFLLGNENRWYDKTLQIIVCANGVSATLCEHSGLDGLSIEPLSEFINVALEESQNIDDSVCAPAATNGDDAAGSRMSPIAVDQDTRERISLLQSNAIKISSKFTFSSITIPNFGTDFFVSRKCPVQSGIQIAIQLASRLFFTRSPPAIETVSMATFRKGRVEVHYVLNEAMKKFVDAASEEASTITRETIRARAYDAAKAHARSLRHTSKGFGFGRHLLAMEWMVNEGEIMPDLFRDPVYLRLKAARVVTSTFQTGWVEGGFVYPVPESILVYVEIKDQSASFSIFGNQMDAVGFKEKLDKAADFIKDLLAE